MQDKSLYVLMALGYGALIVWNTYEAKVLQQLQKRLRETDKK